MCWSYAGTMDHVILERICYHLSLKDITAFRAAFPYVHDMIDGRDIIYQANLPGSTVFNEIASQKDKELITHILNLSVKCNKQYNINAYDQHNPPILYQAIANRHWTYVKELLDLGADPTIPVSITSNNVTTTTTSLGAALNCFLNTPNAYTPWFIFKYILEKTPYDHLNHYMLQNNALHITHHHSTDTYVYRGIRDLVLQLPLDTVKYLITKGLSLTPNDNGESILDFLASKMNDISHEYESYRNMYLQLGEDNTRHNAHVLQIQELLDSDADLPRCKRRVYEQQMNEEWMTYLAKRKLEWELIDLMRDLTMEKNEIEIKMAYVQTISTLRNSREVCSS